MKVKELIEKLSGFDKEKEVIIRFAVSNKDDIGYVLTPKILDTYGTLVAIYSSDEHTSEECAFIGQIDLKQVYEKELRSDT